MPHAKRISTAALAIGGALAIGSPAAGDPVADFYRGRTLAVTVAFGVGGNYDLYARLVGGFIGRHVPGTPKVIVQNLPGAGGRKMANQLYNLGPFDGSAIGVFSQGTPTDQALAAEGVKLDARRIIWLGSPYDTVNVALTWHTAPVKTIEDAKRIEIALGGTGPSSSTVFFPKAMNALLGTRFKVISGYKGSTDLDRAIEQGEVAGRGSVGWNSLKITSDWVAAKKINILVQVGTEKSKELPGVPLLSDLARNAADRKVLEFLSLSVAMGRPFGLPPGVPKARADALRAAFMDTMKDPAFLKAAAKGRLDIDPRDGGEIQALVNKTLSYPPDVIARAKAATGLK